MFHGHRRSASPGSVVQVADGQEKSPKRPGQRSPAPHSDGPLGSSGAAPEEESSTSGVRSGDEPAEAGAQAGLPSGATAEASDKSDPAINTTTSGVTATAEGIDQVAEAVRADKPTTRLPAEAEAGSPIGSNIGQAARAEATAAPQADTTPLIKAVTTIAPQADATPPAKAEPHAAPQADTKAETTPPAKAETTAEPQPDAKAEAKAEPSVTTETSAASGAQAETSTTTGPESAIAGEKSAASEKDPATSVKTDGIDPKNKDNKARAGDSTEANTETKNDKAEAKSGDKAEDKAQTDKAQTDKAQTDKAQPDKAAAPTAAALAAASKGRANRVLRRANPVRVARSTARSTSAWAKRPSGRLVLPAVIAALLLGAAGTAGVYLVPQALQSVPSPSATPGFGLEGEQSAGAVSGPVGLPPSLGGLPSTPGGTAPVAGGTLPGTQPAVGGARPADVLASWAQQTGTQAGIPVVAVQAYGYAELVVGRTTPSCHLTWTTIAAIAKVESSHGSANGAVLNVDGSVAPPIFGLPLDGKGGRQEIRDTDQGALDGDTQFDRAIGPLQFIPQTWTAISVGNGVDADNNGVSDPNDIDDASLAAAKYLCQGGRDLAKPDAWWEAILSYNAVRPYAQKVFDAANDYGQRSKV